MSPLLVPFGCASQSTEQPISSVSPTAIASASGIPIMVFTIAQWSFLMKEDFYIGAASIPPSELARNSKYLSALSARYNYAFPTGYQEVEEILKGNPLHALN